MSLNESGGQILAIQIQMSFDDPKGYTRPWQTKVEYRFMPDSELIEYVCNENEKDLTHMLPK
jgi:hypothetical protein